MYQIKNCPEYSAGRPDTRIYIRSDACYIQSKSQQDTGYIALKFGRLYIGVNSIPYLISDHLPDIRSIPT